MKARRALGPIRRFYLMAMIALLATGAAGLASAATITVNTTADENNTGANCSLREAVVAANTDATYGGCSAGSGDDTIEVPSGTYSLTITGGGTGDVDFQSNITLNGSGLGSTIVQAGASFGGRLFDVSGGGANTVEINGVTLRNANSGGDGAAIRVLNGHTLTLNDSEVTGNTNTSGTDSAGLSNRGTATINRCLFTSNTSSGGSLVNGFDTDDGTMTVIESTVSGNTQSGDFKGALQNNRGSLTIIRCTVSGNTGTGRAAGGVGHNGESGTVIADTTLTDSTVSGNTNADAVVGAGIDVNNGDFVMTNCTISGNLGAGPGLFAYEGVNVVSYSTFSGNQGALGYAGGTGSGSTATTFSNTIVDDGCSRTVDTDGGYNMDIGTGCGFGAGTSQNNADASLAALADNGGLTWTHAIDTTSLAYDAITIGSNCVALSLDQRTAQRAGGTPETGASACDVGAYEYVTINVPVTLAFFESAAVAGGVEFRWTTATETGNIGFHLYEETPTEGLRRLTHSPIQPPSPSSTNPRRYSFFSADAGEGPFYLEDLDAWSHRALTGPFDLEAPYGREPVAHPIPWPEIRAEHRARVVADGGPESGAALERALRHGTTPTAKSGGVQADLLVNADGLYRVTYEDLLTTGVDLDGTSPTDLELTSGGEGVPIWVEAPGGVFGPGSSIEFCGTAERSLYTGTNVYRLQLGDSGLEVEQVSAAPSPQFPTVVDYLETTTVNRQLEYHPGSPTGDPWYDQWLVANGAPAEAEVDIDVDQPVPGTPAELTVVLWGVTNWPASPDHHVRISFNGELVADEVFDGLTKKTITASIPPTGLHQGSNSLTIELPFDQPEVQWDVVALDSYSIEFTRPLHADGGQIGITIPGAPGSIGRQRNLEVDLLSSPDVAVYVADRSGRCTERLADLQIESQQSGIWTATFLHRDQEWRRYLVADGNGFLTPEVTPARPPADITSGTAEYLVLSHPAFVDQIEELTARHSAAGVSVEIVDLGDVYDQFGHGVFGPDGIRNYIRFAAEHKKAEAVLLVGGDTYDYHDYLGYGSMSFVPTPYTQIGIVSYTPADSLLVDLNDDRVPDLPIGRLPVRTSDELSIVVRKLLHFADGGLMNAVFVADDWDGLSDFTAISASLAAQLPKEWRSSQISLDDLPVDDARARLLGTLQEGVRLASYVGHSGPTVWTFDGLFNADDAADLHNHFALSAVVQWGCWNTYHVDPRYNTLAHEFMLNPAGGAALVLGAANLTDVNAEEALGTILLPKLTGRGIPIGVAIQKAKLELAKRPGSFEDVLLGWTLLGDPLATVQPSW